MTDKEPNPLLELMENHQRLAVEATVFPGRFPVFNPFKDIACPEKLLIVFRKSYGTGPGGPILGEEYLVAQPTHIRDIEGRIFRSGSLVALDFLGQPGEVAQVEGFLFKHLLQNDQGAKELISKHLAIFKSND